MGLQWGDIDTQASTIRIERSVSYTPQSGVVVNTPKTANSVRTIPILPSTLGYSISMQIAKPAEPVNGQDERRFQRRR